MRIRIYFYEDDEVLEDGGFFYEIDGITREHKNLIFTFLKYTPKWSGFVKVDKSEIISLPHTPLEEELEVEYRQLQERCAKLGEELKQRREYYTLEDFKKAFNSMIAFNDWIAKRGQLR